MSKTALITGISGMDARALTHILLSKGYTVIGTYRKTANLNLDTIRAEFDSPNLYFEHCSITDAQSVKTLVSEVLTKHSKIDEAYLLAAQSHVGHSFTSAESTTLCSGMSAYYFLDNFKTFSPKTRTYFPATSELFGGDPDKCPFDESSPFQCRSPYSVAKHLGINWIQYYEQLGLYATYGILFNHSNCSRGLEFFIRRVTNGAARIALGKTKELGLGFLGFARDEHWADFGCEMMWKMLQLDSPEVFVVSRGECFHGEEFLDAAFDHFNLNWKKYVHFDETRVRPNEVRKLVGNPQKAIDKLGWNPRRMSFKDHINLMCQYDYDLESGKVPKRPNVFKLYP